MPERFATRGCRSRPPECVPKWSGLPGEGGRHGRLVKLSLRAECSRSSAASTRGGHRHLITTASLKTQSWKDLAEMAKTKGLSGWHSMRKDELVKALVRAAQRRAKLRAAAAAPKRVKTSKTMRRSAAIKSPRVIKARSVHMRQTAHSNGSR